MGTEDNKEIVGRYQDAYNRNDLDALDGLVAQDLVSHSMLPGLPAGLQGAKAAHRLVTAGLPDVHTTIEDLIAEGDKVVMRYTVRGTHLGELMGVPATGKRTEVQGVAIFRLANGKIIEAWGVDDQASLLRQLGVLPGP